LRQGLRCAVEDTLQGTRDLAWALTGLHMHFIVPLDILGGTFKEEFLLAASGRGQPPPLTL
jgi:hypothetical protein